MSSTTAWRAAALLLTTASVLAAAVISASEGMTLAFADAASHVVIPERVFDNGQRTLAQLGTHWAPLFHALALPFSWADGLVSDGASGAVISALAALVTTYFLFELALLTGAPAAAAFIATAVLTLSPSFAYSSVVPMLPSVVMAATAGNIYYLTRWALTGSGSALVWSGLWLSAATLAHFDTWILIPLELAAVVLIAQRKWRAPERTEAASILWGAAATFGVVLFVLMNVAIFGDPLAFLNPVAGSTGDAFGGARHSLKAMGDYPLAAWLTAGPVLAVLGLAGAGAFAWRRRREPERLLPLLLLYPLLWYQLFAAGSGSLIQPDPTLGEWVNLRYAITILPALAFFLAVGLRPLALAAVAGILAIGSGGLQIAQGKVAAWEDARGDVPARAGLAHAAAWLGARYDDGNILIPVHDDLVDRFELLSGIAGVRFIDANDSIDWPRARRQPRREDVRWIVWIGTGESRLVANVVRAAGARECFQRLLPDPKAPVLRIYSADPRGCDGALGRPA